ncbi:hypothetical protein B1759_16560 [Rubrivirga sp. SAORIC476]|nr:hypothetical protein B1759_16560 [Rubrivirga sp. SAORIC476]
MSLPPRVQNSLRLGRDLAAEAPPLQSKRKAWVHVRPVLDGPDFDSVQEARNRDRVGKRYDSVPIRFVLRRVELSPWHLQEEWADDLDVAMSQRPVPDETRVVDTEADVLAALAEWGVDPEALRLPVTVDYPEPPPTLGASPSAV